MTQCIFLTYVSIADRALHSSTGFFLVLYVKPQELLGQDFESILCLEKHAGAELGQAQIKLEFGLYFKQTLLKMIIKTEKGCLSTSITLHK